LNRSVQVCSGFVRTIAITKTIGGAFSSKPRGTTCTILL
jgi:hypothetical protein